MLFIDLKFVEEIAQWLGFTSALCEIFDVIADAVFEKALDFAKVDEITDGADRAAEFEEVADSGAVWIATGEGSEVFELELAFRLVDEADNDVSSVEPRVQQLLELVRILRHAAGEKHRLKTDPTDVAVLQSEAPPRPKDARGCLH